MKSFNIEINRPCHEKNYLRGMQHQVRFNRACLATETRYNVESMQVASLAIILPRHLKIVGPWSDSAGAQAPLHLCCSFGGSHETNSFFARQ